MNFKHYILGFYLIMLHISTPAMEATGLLYVKGVSVINCNVESTYVPIPVYSMEMLKIGYMVLDKPNLLTDSKKCIYKPSPGFVTELKSGNIFAIDYFTYKKTDYLKVFKELVVNSKKYAQVKLTKSNRSFLIELDDSSYVLHYTELAQGIGSFEEYCDDKECHKSNYAQQQLYAKAALESAGCIPSAYDILGIVKLNTGTFAYNVVLKEELQPKYAELLPLQTYIPVKNKRGQLTGTFDSDECN